MTIGYYTDNNVSQGVMRAFSRGGIKVSHINDFDPFNIDNPVFYGIIRGSGTAMRHLQYLGENYHYVDNGYFDAVYMDEKKRKDMSGTYRIVKNDMIEEIKIDPVKVSSGEMNVLIIPPSPYTAFMYDTTPEDWNYSCGSRLLASGHKFSVRDKDDTAPFDEAVKDFDAVLAFNSMALVRAIDIGKAVYSTHGIIRNFNLLGECAPYYDISEIKKFYKDKQYTLEQIADLGIGCLK